MSLKQRQSRWSDEPLLKGGTEVVARIGAGDLPRLGVLARYRHLPTSTIAKLAGGNAAYVQHRLSVLARKPNKFVHRPERQRLFFNANYADQTYELADRGEALLKAQGAIPAERFGDEKLLAHSRMINDTISSIELGGAEMIWWEDHLAHPACPETIKRYLPVKIDYTYENGKRHHAECDYTNDSNGVFGVRYGAQARFFQVEAEHRGEVMRNNLQQPSFLKKFLCVQRIMEHQLYKTLWGIPNLLTLVVCTTQDEIDKRKRLILRLTEGKGATYVLFARVPSMEDFLEDKSIPNLFTHPWQRAGYPDLKLSEGR